MDVSYILNQLGEERGKYFHSVVPPILQSSNFCCNTVDELRSAILNEEGYHLYTRGNNPTTEILRKKLAALANADDALVFGSGMAAMSAAVLSLVQAGDHVICQQNPYSWTKKLCVKILASFGVSYSFVDGSSIDEIESAILPNTKLIILESPNTFTFELQDVALVANLARSKNITTVIDNTYCTSLGQRCIELGIDLEVHSMSKYYAGHSDVVAGAVVGSKALINKICFSGFMNLGGILSPNDAWLVLRGLRTLPIRLERVGATTKTVADFLARHPKVDKVLWPHHASFPQHNLALRQMQWCGGLFSILLKTENTDGVERFCNQLKHFLLAVSWGGHESLAFPACAGMPKGNYKSHVPYNLVRLYCGLEDAEVLMDDLAQALNEV
jgi:cystathionine beta-lyase/cystathionine gamma-synthase